VAEPPEELHASFQRAFNRHDVGAVMALYETDAVLVRRDGAARGSDAIRDVYRRVFAARPTIELRTLGVHRAGDLAMLHGQWVLRETGPDGGEVRREGRNTETVRLQTDGRWLFVIDNPSTP